MLSESLSYPCIFSIFCVDHDDEVVAGRIVGMKKIRDEPYEAKASCNHDKLILLDEFLE
jgi:hypothetical protein